MAREHRKEKEPKERAKRGGPPAAAAPAPSDGVAGEELDENEDVAKAFVHSYCALDYARMVDVVSLRLHRMRRRLKDAVQKRCDAPGSSRHCTHTSAYRFVGCTHIIVLGAWR